MDPFTSRKLTTLRFLAVASVVVYHAYPFEPGTLIVAPPAAGSAVEFAQGFVSLALMRWALPFLGLVSGYLFFRTFAPTLEGYLAKLRTRARTLLVPFLIWSGLGMVFALLVTASPLASLSPYWQIDSVAEALDRWLLHPVIYPLWFLQALLACMVLSPLVYVAVRALRGWVLVLAAAWWVLGWQPDALWPWVSATAFPSFIAGAAVALLGWRMPGRWAHGGAPAWLAAALTAAWLAGAALFTAVRPRARPLDPRRPAPGGGARHVRRVDRAGRAAAARGALARARGRNAAQQPARARRGGPLRRAALLLRVRHAGAGARRVQAHRGERRSRGA